MFGMRLKATNRKNVKITVSRSTGKRKIKRLPNKPSLLYEKVLQSQGYDIICGVDEVGRGSWAGPITVAAVIFDTKRIYKIRDSKMLDAERREALSVRIKKEALDWSVGEARREEIDGLGLSAAIKLAGKRTLEGLRVTPHAILLDGVWDYLSDKSSPHVIKRVPQGDSRSVTVAAASIIAKVHRDTNFLEYDKLYPGYDFAGNKGYPTRRHLEGLDALGPSTFHRSSYAPIKKLIGSASVKTAQSR